MRLMRLNQNSMAIYVMENQNNQMKYGKRLLRAVGDVYVCHYLISKYY